MVIVTEYCGDLFQGNIPFEVIFYIIENQKRQIIGLVAFFEKVAHLVKSFILLGGHQLQLNAVNREKLIDAQKHPGKYPNLTVRVWGWSGYFDELDTPFQDHVIRRTEYTV